MEGKSRGERRDDTCDHGLSRNWKVEGCEKVYTYIYVRCAYYLPCIIGLRAISDTGHPLQVSLVGRFHVGHSCVLFMDNKLLY